MAECGILRGRCSLDSGGSSFKRSPGRKRKPAVGGTDRVMPWPRECGAGSDPLWGTWALQTDSHGYPNTHTHAHAHTSAWPPRRASN